MKSPNSKYALSLACLAIVMPASAQEQAASGPSSFDVSASAFVNCLKRTVQMGMTTKMDPAVFREGFAKSCKIEEAQFRAEGIKQAMRQGRTEAQATQEIDGNISNGRHVFAADQENYIKTGRVPR